MSSRYGAPARCRMVLALTWLGTVLLPAPGLAQFEVIHTFTGERGSPQAGVVRTADGTLYGTTTYGGAWSLGSVFKLTPQQDGTYALSTLASFDGVSGAAPAAPVVGSDGALYGTTEWGGLGFGTVYRLTLDGELTLIHALARTEGAHPKAPLLVASDGTLYGTASAAGGNSACNECGTVFRVSPAGEFAVVHSFTGVDGAVPSSALILADGNLYGTTLDGGTGRGTVFQLTEDGKLTTVHQFTASEGAAPNGLVYSTTDGLLYGTTRFGGTFDTGTVFAMDLGGTVVNQWPFPYGIGGVPEASLVEHPDGGLYGTVRYGSSWGNVFRFVPADGSFVAIHAFVATDGAEPRAPLIVAPDGTLYGTASRGGPLSDGIVFSISSSGAFATVAAFGFPDGSDLAAGLTLGEDGGFYGVTSAGGLGSGTIFRILDGAFSVVHRFSLVGENGALPNSSLVRGVDGALYGTTHQGGAGGLGVVFRVSPAGVSVVHHFMGPDGALPAQMIRGADGALYGTTTLGGPQDAGTVFRIAADGTFTTLHTFSGTDGRSPAEGVIEALDGSLYGTTLSGGAGDAGVIFRLDRATANVVTVYTFPQQVEFNTRRSLFQTHDGTVYLTTWDSAVASVARVEEGGTLTPVVQQLAGPSPLIEATDGLLYLVTQNGGAADAGAIYQLNAEGTLNLLHSFDNARQRGPWGRLLQGADGTLYGTTYGGGADNGGTVFRFSPLTSNLSVAPIVAVYGGFATLSVTLAAGSTPAAGKDVSFTLNGSAITTVRTDATGVASVGPVDLSGMEPGTYEFAIGAQFGGDAGFQASEGNGSLTITRMTPSITWEPPSAIPYGLPLGSPQLRATTTLPGTLVYTPAAGTVLPAGMNQLTVTFVPSDVEHYTEATASVEIDVIAPPTIASLSASVTLPAVTGTRIVWTASASGGIAPLAYRFMVYSASTGAWSVVQDWGVSGSFTMTPARADTFDVQVWVRSAGSPAIYDAWLSSGSFSIQDPSPVSVASFTSSAASPLTVGVPFQLTASASGGTGAFEYQFMWYRPSSGQWTVMKPYSTSNTVAWTPGIGDAGVHLFQVWVRSQGSTATYEAWRGLGPLEVIVSTPTIVTFGCTPAGSANRGSVVTCQATTSGGTDVQYKFFHYTGATGTWSVLRDYSSTNSVAWTPVAEGTDLLQVWVRNGGSSENFQDWRGTSIEVVNPRPSLSHLSANVPLPGTAGAPMVWSVTATGGVSPLQFKFCLLRLATNSWSVLQDYGSANSVAWTPPAPGEYLIQVWAKNDGSTALYDAWASSGVFSITGQPLTVTSITSNVTFPASVGTTMTWTAMATGGSGPVTYQFLLYEAGAGWSVMQSYSASSTVSWTPLRAGTFALQVWARGEGSNEQYEAWLGTGTFQVAPVSISVTSFTTTASVHAAGQSETWTATASGGAGALEYAFFVYHEGTGWSIGQPYSSSNTFSWAPAVAGTYALQVWVRRAGVASAWEAWSGTGYFSVAATDCTIGFAALAINDAPVTSYTECGLTLTAIAPSWQAVTTYGKPAPFIEFYSTGQNPVDGVVTLAGGPFAFLSVDIYSSTTQIPYEITGFAGGEIMFTVVGTEPGTQGNFATIVSPNGASVIIDTLRIRLTNPSTVGPNPVGFDNLRVVR